MTVRAVEIEGDGFVGDRGGFFRPSQTCFKVRIRHNAFKPLERFQTSTTAIPPTGTNGLLRYFLETASMGSQKFPTILVRMGLKRVPRVVQGERVS